jgi:uncharacterized protein involved in outer membrane biogenesis
VGRKAWWLAGLGALVALPVVGVGIALAVMDPDDLKPQLIDAVQLATGRTMTLGGKLRISRSLWPTIEVSDIQLANLPGGTRPDMARAERIEAQLSVIALLWHRLEVTRLTLIGPNILFEQVGDKPNWVFDTAPKPPGAGAFTLRFRDVHVQNGMVTFRLPAHTRVVGIRSLDFRHGTDDGPLDLSSVLVYSDNQPFSLHASAQPTAGDAGPWTTQLAFAAFDAAATANGSMTLGGDYDLQVEGTAPALEKLNALLPQMRLPALRQVSLATHLTNGPVRGDLPVIGTTQVHFASADLGDRVTGLRLGATAVSLAATGAPASVDADGSYAGQGFRLRGTFGVPSHPDARASVPVDMTVQAGAGPAKGSLSVKGRLALDAGHFEGLDAGIALRTPSLASLRALTSPALPALADVAVDGRAVVPASLATVSLHDAKLSAREGDLAGDATVGLGAGVAFDGKLRSTRLDLDAVLAAFGSPAPAPSGAATAGPMIPDTPLPWAQLRGPAIGLAATIGTLTFHQQPWRGLTVALQLHDGTLQVSRLQLADPAGAMEASFSVNAAHDPVPVSVTLQAPGIPLAMLAQRAGLPGEVDGAMRVDLRLTGSGRTVRELAASLDGPVSATTIGGGSLSNAALVKLAAAALEALHVTVPAQGRTTINCLGLIGTFSKGVGRFPTIAVDTTYLTVAGAGQVDLRAETVALKLQPLARLSGSSVSVPVVVDGPFRAIQGRLDASGLDKVGLLVDALFGGDKPDVCGDAGLAPHR